MTVDDAGVAIALAVGDVGGGVDAGAEAAAVSGARWITGSGVAESSTGPGGE